MRNKLAITLGSGTALLVASAARASVTTQLLLSPEQPTPLAVQEDPSLADRTTFDLRITTNDSCDWTNSSLKFVLSEGSFYNAWDGGDVPTTPGRWNWPGRRHLRYDTFVACPPSFSGGSPFVVARHTSDGIGSAIFSGDTVSVVWFDIETYAVPGTYTIARLTVSNDAVGTFFGSGFDNSMAGMAQPFNGAINKQLRWDTNTISSGPQGGTGTWNTTGRLFWNGATNAAWDNARNDVAIFGAQPGSVSLGAVSASALKFDTAGYVLNGGTITLTGSARITANQDATINSGLVSGVGLSKGGGAGLTINSSLAGITGAINVAAGQLNVRSLSGPPNTIVGPGASLVADHVRQNGLSIGAAAVVTIRPNGGNAGVSVLNGLDIAGVPEAWTGKLDVNDNDLIVRHNDGDHGAAKLAQITDQLKSGLNMPNGYWDGNGITSSVARDDATYLTAPGVINNDLGDGTAIYTEFSGQSVDANCILIRYTYYGDNDLSGFVDLGNDFCMFVDGFNAGGQKQGWLWGDYSYDGIIDLDTDFSLFVGAYNNQGDPLSAVEAAGLRARALGVAAVPEPGTLALWLMGATALFRRQRRR